MGAAPRCSLLRWVLLHGRRWGGRRCGEGKPKAWLLGLRCPPSHPATTPCDLEEESFACADQSPIPLRALKPRRSTTLVGGSGEVQEVIDQWSLFAKREERFDWWKGITEFDVDCHHLRGSEEGLGRGSGGGAKKKRGEGEVFEHEIPKEEWPEWVNQDREEFEKIVRSGGLRVLSLEESREVKERLRKEGKINRILPSRMVRRYKPAEAPGLPRTKKSRFCIRGDRDPDAAHLSRFAPTVTTSTGDDPGGSEQRIQRGSRRSEVSLYPKSSPMSWTRSFVLQVQWRKHAWSTSRADSRNQTGLLRVMRCTFTLASHPG